MSKKTSKNSKTKNRNPFKLFGWKPNFIGITSAVLFLCLSLLPSLLPRPWWLQGIVSGLSMGIGYGLGLAASSIFRWLTEFEFSHDNKHKTWRVAVILLPLLSALFMILGVRWQNEVRELVGAERIELGYATLVIIMGGLVFILCIKIGQGIRRLGARLTRFFKKHVSPRLAVAVGLAATAFLVYYIVSGLFVSNFYRLADGYYGRRDYTVPEGVSQPTVPEKSGSPESLVAWDKIGYQGRKFVGTGPSKQMIEDYTKQAALEPVRVYSGKSTAGSAEDRARIAVEELKRTKAFEREILVIATATGTGWLDPSVVDALEYLHSGNTAIVSQQYSYLPSWISFLVDQERAREAGRVLYDAVIEEWTKQPEATRPKLLVYGLSLGSFGSQAAFSGINDMRRSVDGVLYAGSPNDSEVWRKTTDNRDAGSPEWQPVYKNGTSVRFASTKEDIIREDGTWTDDTRILFLQHATDPVVWFSFDLIFNKPDWLGENRGPGVSPSTRYFPIVTFLQVTLDQAIAASAPKGFGHYYVDTPVYAWAAIAPPSDWTLEKSDILQKFMNER